MRMRKPSFSAMDEPDRRGRLNMVMTGDRFSSDDFLMIPCSRDCDQKNPKGFKHSLTAQICIENKPLKVQTILSIGKTSKLKSYLKNRLGTDVIEDIESNGMFEGVSGLTFPCFDEDGAGYVIIWMPKFDWSISDIETLDHETVHAAVMVMRMSGVRARIFSAKKDDDVDDEGFAYSKSSMLSMLLKELAKRQHAIFRKSAPSKVV